MTYLDLIILGYIVNIAVIIIAFVTQVVWLTVFAKPLELIEMGKISNAIKSKRAFLKSNKISYYTQESFAVLLPYTSLFQFMKFYLRKGTLYEKLQDEDNRLQKLIDEKI